MKIFLSWSGDRSREFAEQLKPWLEQVLPGTEVWLSSEDIDKGTIWFTAIIAELEHCNAGVVCITRENYLSPWLHFEAGGMVKGLGKGRVATILLDIDYPDLRQPLNQFNGLRPNREGMRHLIRSFNKLTDRPIKDIVVERAFDKFWPEFDEQLQLLFPESHKSAQAAEPVHIPAKPVETVFGASPRQPRRRNKKSEESVPQHPGLFNGIEE